MKLPGVMTLLTKYLFSRLLLLVAIASLVSACASGPSVGEGVRAGNFEIQEDVDVTPGVKTDFEKAVQLLQKKDYERGIRLMTRVSERSEKSIAPYINLGIAYRETGEIKKAEEVLTRALRLSPLHPAVNNEMGMVYRKLGKFTEARRTYERILERFPDFHPARKNLGILCDLYLNDLPCAKANYDIYIKADPGDKSVAMWIVDLEKRMGSR